MQKELGMDLRVRLTESQYEVLKTGAEASDMGVRLTNIFILR
jgi:hypothetical protein